MHYMYELCTDSGTNFPNLTTGRSAILIDQLRSASTDTCRPLNVKSLLRPIPTTFLNWQDSNKP